MTRSTSALQYRRLRAPKDDGETLVDPPLVKSAEMLQENLSRAASSNRDVAGHSLRTLAAEARQHLLESSRTHATRYRDVAESATEADAPIIMTGHQPALYHPGVWIKNFILDRLARDRGAHAVHLLIDNDLLGDPSIRVPAGNVTDPRAEAVAIDQNAGDLPFESRTILDPQQFASFADRVYETVKPFTDEPLVREIWPDVIAASKDSGGNIGSSLAQARHLLEGRWGLQTLEVPLSAICDHASFRCFAIHILSDLGRFADLYNTSLAEYRDVNRVRSRTHPVPPLATDGEWLEAPLWLWTDAEPRRQRLFARSFAGQIEISDRGQIHHRLASNADDSAEQLAKLAQQGLRLRPRALLTTMFARLFLCDLFIHGIGGAKYDQLTDAIIERFFSLDPPTFMVATGTAKLPIDRPQVSRKDLRGITRLLRDLDFNPQRHVDESPEAQHLAEMKYALLAAPHSPDEKLQRHRQITQLNSEMQPFVLSRRKTLLDDQSQAVQQLRAERLLGSREFSFCLFPERSLRSFLLDI